MRPQSLIALALFTGFAHPAAQAAEDLVYKDAAGRTRVHSYPVDTKFLNPWPAAWEDAFWDRANAAIRQNAKPGGFGNSYFENEKAMYPNAMFAFLGGYREPALAALQAEDADAKSWNTVTDGIDFFPCFTLKGQMRKYFLFGPYLKPEYRERMKKAARTWTEKDPLRRPHPYYKGAKEGWTPESKNSWVDVRNTDNLQAMRETSVYLMAEETGNEVTRALYKDRIRKFVVNLYAVGQGEWDSENYQGHTLTAYLNLYDFARDPDVKALAKAALDYLVTSGAVKFYRGAFNGPSCRDYNHFGPFNGSGGDHMAFYFDDYPTPPEHYERDQVHLITSAYRPPSAVVELAHKNFARPCELFAAHSAYDALRDGADKPVYFETTTFGNTYQFGTLDRGTGFGDINGFKLAAYSAKRGAEFFIANATTDPGKMGSPQYGNAQVGSMNVAHYGNACILLNAPGDSPLLFLTPKTVLMDTESGLTFFRYDKTWLAVRPINLSITGPDAKLTDAIAKGAPQEQIVAAKGTGGKVCGFVLEIGEAETHKDFKAFQAAIRERAKLDVSGVSDGTVLYTTTAGKTLKITFGERPAVWRDGAAVDWAARTSIYQPAAGGKAPVSLGWKQGELHVEAGGKTFDCSVKPDGTVAFANR